MKYILIVYKLLFWLLISLGGALSIYVYVSSGHCSQVEAVIFEDGFQEVCSETNRLLKNTNIELFKFFKLLTISIIVLLFLYFLPSIKEKYITSRKKRFTKKISDTTVIFEGFLKEINSEGLVFQDGSTISTSGITVPSGININHPIKLLLNKDTYEIFSISAQELDKKTYTTKYTVDDYVLKPSPILSYIPLSIAIMGMLPPFSFFITFLIVIYSAIAGTLGFIIEPHNKIYRIIEAFIGLIPVIWIIAAIKEYLSTNTLFALCVPNMTAYILFFVLKRLEKNNLQKNYYHGINEALRTKVLNEA